ncbi:hypothetical protein [Chondromyces apiculatus]|uniref:Uncharacterized protein n=1 Tax=Chondromyces apiculatus DSM 436 TaxID=1192034 RepID=A0A017T485_9BACT|nr:hypothetical protein [Chondromyces apiculatus]EYF03827.1 Hypothetical protein CAP_5091 [Chondromyces apiculatus DSM 436]
MNLPTGWDGSCRSISPLSSPQSILAEGTGVTGCKPILAEPPSDDVAWMTKAKACATSETLEACEDIGMLCAPPAGDTMPGARQCIYHRDADVSCPGGYAQRLVFQDGLSNTISCSPCSCRSPEGSACRAEVRTYEDPVCTELVNLQTVTLGVELCRIPASASSQIGSVEASFTVNLPGSCTPQGGQITNGGEPLRPSTFCCASP